MVGFCQAAATANCTKLRREQFLHYRIYYKYVVKTQNEKDSAAAASDDDGDVDFVVMLTEIVQSKVETEPYEMFHGSCRTLNTPAVCQSAITTTFGTKCIFNEHLYPPTHFYTYSYREALYKYLMLPYHFHLPASFSACFPCSGILWRI